MPKITNLRSDRVGSQNEVYLILIPYKILSLHTHTHTNCYKTLQDTTYFQSVLIYFILVAILKSDVLVIVTTTFVWKALLSYFLPLVLLGNSFLTPYCPGRDVHHGVNFTEWHETQVRQSEYHIPSDTVIISMVGP